MAMLVVLCVVLKKFIGDFGIEQINDGEIRLWIGHLVKGCA